MSESDENEKEQIFRNIRPEDAVELIEEMQEDPDFIILDVRTPKEFTDGHIECAVNIDYQGENFTEEIEVGDKEKKYLICCGSGVRAVKAMDIMKDLGYLEVYNILGGIRVWKISGYPLIEE
ncbi:MAG: rhodanese-like domain-containing protein [Methanobacterium sp.]|nr:rhodanese-like domain-containing protein [Methanobacterium sp.]